MAFDGFTTAALTKEFRDQLTGGRVYRIIQPEPDELLLTIRPEVSRGGGQVRLVLSADASLPLAYLTEENRQAPDSAPAFCMLLRKYLQNGIIRSVTQPGLERIIRFEIEHRNEMGDLCRHILLIELMGKHSNIILTEPESGSGLSSRSSAEPAVPGGNNSTAEAVSGSAEETGEVIVDSIKHISQMVSSVREVLPGRPYFIPETRNKSNPLAETGEHFKAMLPAENTSAPGFLLKHYAGFSTVMSEEVVFRAHLSQDRSAADLSPSEQEAFWSAFCSVLDSVRAGSFAPTVYYHVGAADVIAQGEPVEYSALPLSMYRDLPEKRFDSVSALIESFYREKNAVTRIRQKSADLRKVVSTILERDLHKYDLQAKQLKDTQKRDRYRVYGELLNAYGYNIPEGASSAELDNYYTGEKLTVPLDPTRSAKENAQHYFERYNKLKRTAEALDGLMKEVKAEIDELQSIRTSLDLSVTESDLVQIRREMEDAGFVHRHTDRKDRRNTARLPEAKPLHYLSSDGYDIYVGKNNTQNDQLTFHFAKPSDIWFHANDIPGSHVILRTEGKPFEQIPDRAFEEAARLAAWYSQGRDAGRVEVDYLEKKNVKKPSGARPGFVVYYTNYSINVDADIRALRQVTE